MLGARKIVSLSGNKFRDEYSLAFDGSDDYIDFGDVFDLGTNDFSISLWVKTSDFHGKYFIGKREDANNRWYLRASGDAPRFQFYSVVSGSAGIAYYGGTGINLDNLQNQWVHFVLSADRDGNIVGYINGVLDDTDSADATDLDNTGSLYISRFDSNYSAQNVSEVAIYSKALSYSEVKTIYNGREPFNHKASAFSGNLTAWWRMGDGVLDGFNPDAQTQGLIQNYSSQLEDSVVTSWTNGSAPFNTLVSSGANITSMINSDSGTDNVHSGAGGLSVLVTDIYRISFDVAGTVVPTVVNKLMFKFSPNVALNSSTFGGSITHTGSYVFYASPATTTIYVGFRAVEDVNCSITNFRMQKVTNNPGLMTNMDAVDFEGDTP